MFKTTVAVDNAIHRLNLYPLDNAIGFPNIDRSVHVQFSRLILGRPATTYVDQLRNDTGLSIAELKSIMENRKEWMKLVNGVRVRSK